MLFVIASDNRTFRKQKLGEILEPFTESEIIVFSDNAGELADLEQYLYPSLFSVAAPIVHAQFMLDVEFGMEFTKKLAASPTVFVFEELTIPKAAQTVLKKSGAVIHESTPTKTKKSESDIFSATLCITAADKKSRWLAYRSALEKHSIEAIIGILYWKVRTLAAKEKTDGKYQQLYRAMLDAQSRSWESGAPLDALIEKVILTN